MQLQQLESNQVDTVLLALDECYRRLNKADISAKDLTQAGFTLMFKSAYESLASQEH
ncbi:hypothetical protein [Photobacterium lutimaris]|uniref:hypothetical protein n=1 Tax=Photobacterium lutimaris TaxID=388278 RepID=UPI0010D01229|nr:hypothetical protein [Photobacterium lutimaris]TDR79063.1 hypothetical protein DFP78_101578 [Photobacterium lutimaris]